MSHFTLEKSLHAAIEKCQQKVYTGTEIITLSQLTHKRKYCEIWDGLVQHKAIVLF